MALVVFDDIPYYSYFTPSITAVGVDADEFGRKAASLLKEQMMDNGSHQAKVIITPVQLFKRESTIGVRVNSL